MKPNLSDPCSVCGEPVSETDGAVMDMSPPIVPVVCPNGHEDGRFGEWDADEAEECCE